MTQWIIYLLINRRNNGVVKGLDLYARPPKVKSVFCRDEGCVLNTVDTAGDFRFLSISKGSKQLLHLMIGKSTSVYSEFDPFYRYSVVVILIKCFLRLMQINDFTWIAKIFQCLTNSLVIYLKYIYLTVIFSKLLTILMLILIFYLRKLLHSIK